VSTVVQGYAGRREVAVVEYSRRQVVSVALTGTEIARSMDLNNWEVNPR
jgi:hypothetical protein